MKVDRLLRRDDTASLVASTTANDSGSSSTSDASATSALVCPTNMLSTCDITCKKNEQCQLRAQSATECAKYYCSAAEGRSGSTPVGAIVGGVVGGVVAMAIIGVALWFFFYRNKLLQFDDDINMDGMNSADNDQDSLYIISNRDSQAVLSELSSGGRPLSSEGTPMAEKRPPNRRLSTYELFTRPKARYLNRKKVENRSINSLQRRQRQYQQQHLSQQQLYMQPLNRSSVATSILTTNASNMLPIAYIPGVTVRPTVNNTRSIYSYENSYETESVFSDLNTIENALIVGGGNKQQPVENKDLTMTAIKAKPRLVNVGKIDEEDEDEEDEEADTTKELKEQGSGAVSDDENTRVGNSLGLVKYNGIENDLDLTDSDLDIDLDIGEIVRATSLRRQNVTATTLTNDTPEAGGNTNLNASTVQMVQLRRPPTMRQAGELPASSQGLFLLDVDIDTGSPFEDPMESESK